ncbi:YopX family protein [Bacillus infantis]|uniref:YopX family protein n=1 Tax=Bacillus infantis TaxID=324767 RepID=UPI002FBE9FF2
MREIKFRAWLTNKNMMYQFDDDSLGDHFNRLAYGYREFELMQYTGLKDKKGQEIYEGDILSAFHGTQITAVTWNEKYGLYEIVLQVSGLSEPMEELLGNHLDVVEVIGNIYENPELLEGI